MQEITFRSKVRIEQDTLVIESFKTTDSDIVSYFKDKKSEEYERLIAYRWGFSSPTVGQRCERFLNPASRIEWMHPKSRN